jgi:putative transposase
LNLESQDSRGIVQKPEKHRPVKEADIPGTDRSFYLPRLSPEHYQGDAVVHWSLSIANRETGWLDDSFHARFREIMLHAAARQRMLCPIYCLMPDHLHLVWMGLGRDSDQRNGMKFLREHLAPFLRPCRFQHQAHDHVLRERERTRNAFVSICHYILENPFEAELVSREKSWPFCGAIVPGYPTLHPLKDDFWRKFWKIYLDLRDPDAGNIHRPSH